MPIVDAHWMAWASCRREDPEIFFPISDSGPASDQVLRAKAVCRTCPVVRQCLSYALETGERAGIWGGTTPDERRMLRQAVS